MSTKNDYYDILGIGKTANAQEIKSAYRKKALEWHPDRHQGADKEEAEKKFKEINEAYQVLSDTNKRSAYDNYGHDAFSPGGGFRGQNPFSGGNYSSQGGPFTYTWSSGGGSSPFGNMDFGDPFDIFESFFGGGSPFRQQARIPRYSIKIDFFEAAKGANKEINIGGKKRKVKIPAGVDEGTRINFGDFTLSVNVMPHEFFEREGDDVYINLKVPYSLLVLGGNINVPTIDEEVKLKIRPGTQSGTMIRLKSRGIINIHSKKKGDQYVRLQVSVPEKLNRYQKDLFQEIQKEGF